MYERGIGLRADRAQAFAWWNLAAMQGDELSRERLELVARRMNARVARYDFTFPAECGGHTFSYFEGEGFHALGHHQGDRVVVDVLVGGGPFSAPRLWGTYDQVLNDSSVAVHLLVGDGQTDGFGLLKTSFMAGIVSRMPKAMRDRLGREYHDAVSRAAATLPPGVRPTLPALRQATAPAPEAGS